MTIDEAIKALSNPTYNTYRTVNPRFPEAHQLGIEALKRLKQARDSGFDASLDSLPGETKD